MREAHRVLAVPLHQLLKGRAALDAVEKGGSRHPKRSTFRLLYDCVGTETETKVEGQPHQSFVTDCRGFAARTVAHVDGESERACHREVGVRDRAILPVDHVPCGISNELQS